MRANAIRIRDKFFLPSELPNRIPRIQHRLESDDFSVGHNDDLVTPYGDEHFSRYRESFCNSLAPQGNKASPDSMSSSLRWDRFPQQSNGKPCTQPEPSVDRSQGQRRGTFSFASQFRRRALFLNEAPAQQRNSEPLVQNLCPHGSWMGNQASDWVSAALSLPEVVNKVAEHE